MLEKSVQIVFPEMFVIEINFCRLSHFYQVLANKGFLTQEGTMIKEIYGFIGKDGWNNYQTKEQKSSFEKTGFAGFCGVILFQCFSPTQSSDRLLSLLKAASEYQQDFF